MMDLISNIVIAACIGTFLSVAPTLTRKSYLFGVKIPMEVYNCPEAIRMKKRYVAVCLSGATTVFVLYILVYTFVPAFLPSAWHFHLLFVPIFLLAYIPNWKHALNLKEARGWKVSESAFADTKSSYSRGNLSYLPWGWYVAGLIIVIIGFIVGYAAHPLPDKFSFRMSEFNQLFDGSWFGNMPVNFGLPLSGLFVLVLFWFVGIFIQSEKLQIDPQDPDRSFTQHRILRRRMGHCWGLSTLTMTSMFLLAECCVVFPGLPAVFRLGLFLMFLPIALPMAVALLAGQGGCKIKVKNIGGSTSAIDHGQLMHVDASRSDDKFWVLGMFYCNSNDPSYFVEGRFIGMGINFARPLIVIASLAFFYLFAKVFAIL